MKEVAKPLNGLVKQAIRIRTVRKGQQLSEQIFQHTPIRIGRLLDNDIVLPFDFVSRYHCELRFDGERWMAVDLGSKNGLLGDGTNRLDEVKLKDGVEFRIQEVTIEFHLEMMPEITQGFDSLREAKTVVGGTALRFEHEEDDEHSIIRHDPRVHGKAKGPIVDVDLSDLLFAPHPMIHQARDKALQMTVIWHDQVLDAREFRVGDTVSWDWMGEPFHLGTVRAEKAKLKIPKGCQPSATAGAGSNGKFLMVTLSEPAAFRVSDTLFVFFRYVPKSKDIALNTGFIDKAMVDPMILSSTVHGAMALTTLLVTPKPKTPAEPQQPDRVATILIAPTPVQVAAATPTPTPVPTPEPTPTPKKEVAEKPVPTPKPKVKVVEKKVKRPVAVAKAEKPPEPKVEQKLPPPPKEQQVVKSNTIPAQGNNDKPAPTPQPFQAKSVGALKMLSALNPGPAANVAGVEKIQISRAPASVSGSMMGREPVQGTGDMITNLNQSATGGGTGKGDGVSGVAIGGKGAAGSYQVAGLGGKAGKRAVRGNVLGGATYTELSKNEGLSREQVMKVVQKYQGQIQACYERSLMSNPDIVGRAEFEWEIQPSGKVTFVKVKEATIRNGEGLLDCVKGVFAGMQFPQAKNGESTTPTIGLPFGRL
jgi:hypothetical protein